MTAEPRTNIYSVCEYFTVIHRSGQTFAGPAYGTAHLAETGSNPWWHIETSSYKKSNF